MRGPIESFQTSKTKRFEEVLKKRKTTVNSFEQIYMIRFICMIIDFAHFVFMAISFAIWHFIRLLLHLFNPWPRENPCLFWMPMYHKPGNRKKRITSQPNALILLFAFAKRAL